MIEAVFQNFEAMAEAHAAVGGGTVLPQAAQDELLRALNFIVDSPEKLDNALQVGACAERSTRWLCQERYLDSSRTVSWPIASRVDEVLSNVDSFLVRAPPHTAPPSSSDP